MKLEKQSLLNMDWLRYWASVENLDHETVDKQEGWTGNRDRQTKRDLRVDQEDPVVQEVPALLADPDMTREEIFAVPSQAPIYAHVYIFLIKRCCCFFM